MEEVVQIQVTHSDREQLAAIVEDLLERRLIACGQLIGPIESAYRWEGSLQRDQEWLALLKTAQARSQEAVARLHELHSFEVPEILVIEVQGGARAYLEWVLAETGVPP